MLLILLSVVTLKVNNDTLFLFNRMEAETVAYRLSKLCDYEIALQKYQSLMDSMGAENIYLENSVSLEAAKLKAVKDDLVAARYKLRTRNIVIGSLVVSDVILLTVILLHYF